MQLPRNALGNLIRNQCNSWLFKRPLLRCYGKKRQCLEVTSLMDYFGNRGITMLHGNEYSPLLPVLKPLASVLDVGANSGNLLFWLYEHDFCTRSVAYCGIEPDPATMAQLERNHKRNGFYSTCLIQAAAVATNEKSVSFQQSTVSNNSSLLRNVDSPGEWKTITVPAFNLHNLRQDYDLVSIDIEGGEFDLLSAPLPPCLKNAPLALIEWHEPFSNLIFLRSRMYDTHDFIGYCTHPGGLGNAAFKKRAT